MHSRAVPAPPAAEGLLGEWSGDRATVLAVVVLVVLAPLASCRCGASAHLCMASLLVCPCSPQRKLQRHLGSDGCRDLSALAGSSALALVASCMAAAAVLALTALAASQHALHHPRAWPAWPELGAGGAGWFRRAAEVLAVVPVLLLATLCHPSLHAVVSCLRSQKRQHRFRTLVCSFDPPCCVPRLYCRCSRCDPARLPAPTEPAGWLWPTAPSCWRCWGSVVTHCLAAACR